MTPAESLSTPDNQPHGQVDATLSFAGFSAPISVVAVESGGLSPGVDQKSGTSSDTVMKAQTHDAQPSGSDQLDASAQQTPHAQELEDQGEYDLAIEDGVRKYLANTDFATQGRIEILSGGSANWVWRVWLDKPLDGRPTVILKHTRGYVRVAKNVPFTAERQVRILCSKMKYHSIFPSYLKSKH